MVKWKSVQNSRIGAKPILQVKQVRQPGVPVEHDPYREQDNKQKPGQSPPETQALPGQVPGKTRQKKQQPQNRWRSGALA